MAQYLGSGGRLLFAVPYYATIGFFYATIGAGGTWFILAMAGMKTEELDWLLAAVLALAGCLVISTVLVLAGLAISAVARRSRQT